MKSAAGRPEPIREVELLTKLIVDKHLTSIIIFFIIIFLWLQDFSHFTWLQGLHMQSLVHSHAWLSAPLPPRHLRAQCRPPASSNLTPGASLHPGSHSTAGGAISVPALGEFQAIILYLLEAHSQSGSSVKPDHSGGTSNSSSL